MPTKFIRFWTNKNWKSQLDAFILSLKTLQLLVLGLVIFGNSHKVVCLR
ncbi:MAG: hypothetical protein ACEY3J_00325 [Arsenophonus sp.]